MEPFYTHHIFVCRNQRECDHPRGCCGDERGEQIATRFKQLMRKHGVKQSRANKAMCLDRCEHGPVVVIYPEQTWYRIEDIDRDVEAIVVEHLVGGTPRRAAPTPRAQRRPTRNMRARADAG